MSKAGPSQKAESASRSKLVIRRLPPALPEAIFWTAVEPWINDQTCLWKRYVKGKPGDGRDQRPVFSRAYVLMSTPEALVSFHRGFDGHLFRSKTGEEFQAVVEFAPVQKTPFKAKAKVDTRQGTIDDDPDYKSFLESLSAPPTNPVLEPTLPTAQPTSTPLLDHLRAQGKNKKNAKKTKASEASAKDAALASVNKAASKRAPAAQGSAVMVAGKGRDVKLGPNSSAETADGSKSGKKRARNKSKKETEQGEQPKVIAKPPPKPPVPTPKSEIKAGDGLPRDALPDRGRGGGPGRGRGRARPPGPDSGSGRSARGAVMEILTKNAEGGGGSKRGGRGRGQGTKKEGGEGSQALASQARIDA